MRDGLCYVKASQMQRRFFELLSNCSGRRRNPFGGGPVKVFNSAPAPVSFAAGPDLCVCVCVYVSVFVSMCVRKDKALLPIFTE